MTVRENARARDAAFEALLERSLGGKVPDLTERILAPARPSNGSRHPVPTTPQRPSSWQRLGAAGALLLGLAAVGWTAWHRPADEPAPRPVAQDPLETSEQPRLVSPLDVEEGQALLEQAADGFAHHSAVYTLWFPVGNGRARWLERFDAGSVRIALAETENLAQLVGQCIHQPLVDPLGITDEQMLLDFVLPDQRALRVEISRRGQALQLRLRGLGHRTVTGELAQLATALMESVEAEAERRYAFASDAQVLAATPPGLRELFAYGVDDAGLAALATRSELARAKLVGRKVDESPHDYEGVSLGATALRHLAACKDLRQLELVAAEVDEAALEALASIRSLRHLTIIDGKRCELTSKGLQHLARLPLLETLEFEGCAIDDQGLQVLASCIGLKSIRLTEITSGTGQGLRALLRSPGLVELRLDKVSAIGIFRDAAAPSLRRFECAQSELTLEGIDTLPSLEHVSLGECALDQASVEALGRSSVQHLILDDLAVDERWAAVTSPRLRALTLGRVRATDSAWRALLESCHDLPDLRRIAIRQSRLTDAQVSLLSRLPPVEVLDIRYNRDLSEPALERLARRLPSTRLLSSKPR